jgi:hypothetical protein
LDGYQHEERLETHLCGWIEKKADAGVRQMSRDLNRYEVPPLGAQIVGTRKIDEPKFYAVKFLFAHGDEAGLNQSPYG